jgi:hypothetical protein
MPPTLKLSALVALALHLSLVSAAVVGEEDSEGDSLVDGLVLSLALLVGSLSSDPQAVIERARMAEVAITFTQVEVLDRFTW